MKKLLTIIIGVLIGIVFISCESASGSATTDNTGDVYTQTNIITLMESGRGYKIYKDNETGCEYLAVYSQGPNGGVCVIPMYDVDGKPKIR